MINYIFFLTDSHQKKKNEKYSSTLYKIYCFTLYNLTYPPPTFTLIAYSKQLK